MKGPTALASLRQGARALIRPVRRWSQAIRSLNKRRRCRIASTAVLYPASRIENHLARDCIAIGRDCHILAQLLTFAHGGQIRIGERCFIGENTRIWSASSIQIGDRVLISYGVSIHDCNAHSLSAQRRAAHFDAIFSSGHPRELPDVDSQAIVIGNDVWIGFGVTILKGVSIGDGAVVAACSLVTKDVEPFTLVAGNPARFVKHLPRDELLT